MLPAPECRAVLEAALRAAGAPADAAVGLTLSDDEELTELNEEHLRNEGPTDVLSFPLLPPSAFPAHRGRTRPCAGLAARSSRCLPTRCRISETSSISVERAIAQADAGQGGQTNEVRWAPADELRLLITHGALHLCGWDHAEPDEAAAMRALERRVLGIEPEA